MPRSEIQPNRDAQEIGEAVIGIWFKALPTAVGVWGISNTNPVMIRPAWPAFLQGDEIWLSNIDGIPSLENVKFKVGPIDAGRGEFALHDVNDRPVNGTGLGRYAGRNGLVTRDAVGNLEDFKQELEVVLSKILVARPMVVVDPADGQSIHVVLPRIPDGVRSRQDLIDYLARFHQYAQNQHYHEELGKVTLFGCR
jgi:hypothetical protein